MEMQDLQGQYRELATGERTRAMEEEHFHIDLDEARKVLEEKIRELEAELSPSVRERYERIVPYRDRVVVPVINGVCYGCFVSIPTATAGDRGSHQDLESCQNCGCFIYILH
jgi:predicted  nucleic acid-binding Zn-ribbon protein